MALDMKVKILPDVALLAILNRRGLLTLISSVVLSLSSCSLKIP